MAELELLITDKEMLKIRVGEFVKEHLAAIVKYCQANPEHLSDLQQVQWCAENFNISYSFVRKQSLFPELNARYWVKVWPILNEGYRFCSQFGGSQIQNNETLSTRHGRLFYEYLDQRDLLEEKYRNEIPLFIVTGAQQQFHNVVKQANKEEKLRPLNLILYGPPGTGKTFSTIDKALDILVTSELEPDEIPKSIQELKIMFPRQVEFVTFHQSFSYEDFVEGIQAKTQDGKISYQVEDGVFKRICIEAQYSKLDKSYEVQLIDYSVSYDQLLQTFREKLPYKIFTKNNKPLLIKAISEQDSLHIYHEDSEVMHIVGRKRLRKLYESFPTIDALNSVSNINNEFREVIGGSNSSAYWAVLNKALHFKQEMSEQIESGEVEQDSAYLTIEQKKKQLLDVDEADIGVGFPHILIIDEINRGNISRIFGELITLIEPSKRAGNDEAIEVTLPYSKEPFSVPNNLYIIGTMNTADRSLALMDTALRRRFDFIEMMPLPGLVTVDLEGVDLRKMLAVMNQRIEALYDREHMLGHAFLMNLHSLADLRHAFKNKILPLLEEYFYDDWQKIRWVLGASADNFYQRQSFTNLFTDTDAPNDVEKFQRKNLDDLNAQAFQAIYQGV